MVHPWPSYLVGQLSSDFDFDDARAQRVLELPGADAQASSPSEVHSSHLSIWRKRFAHCSNTTRWLELAHSTILSINKVGRREHMEKAHPQKKEKGLSPFGLSPFSFFLFTRNVPKLNRYQ